MSVPMTPPIVFADWLRSNMPPDTIISDPDWWAMAIWSAARRAINAAPVASGGKASVPDAVRVPEVGWTHSDRDRAYAQGWNACRAAMLAATPEPPRCTP